MTQMFVCVDHKLPNGILPQQFTSIYEAFEALELEGLTWTAFVKGSSPRLRDMPKEVSAAGLTILSEQTEVGVFEEVHFYDRLRNSRLRVAPSAVLRDGVAEVLRMMCYRQQIRMDNEPQTAESPLFEVYPIYRENFG